MLSGQEYGPGADYWSLGVMLYEMLVGTSPFVPSKNGDEYRAEVSKMIKAAAAPESGSRLLPGIDPATPAGDLVARLLSSRDIRIGPEQVRCDLSRDCSQIRLAVIICICVSSMILVTPHTCSVSCAD